MMYGGHSHWWECCEYCGGHVRLFEVRSYERAICPICLALHAWSGESESWVGLGEGNSRRLSIDLGPVTEYDGIGSEDMTKAPKSAARLCV